MGAIHLTDINFDQEVLKSNIPVLVDFWASWCGPCRMVGPIVEELSNDYQGKVKITKVDVDANPEKSGQFGIRSIPTMLIFKNGQIIDTLIGAMPKEAIAARLDAARAK
ncbi:thioredoxin [candidate division TA06 bacterium]|uniref:Thioredoxin n=1 Tax=candidate division TA06 bacterium TaxID=2250710 RepID=A0A933IAZ7_UNCT6|nr:thioredoxin [candidate division TA06 bacterium]